MQKLFFATATYFIGIIHCMAQFPSDTLRKWEIEARINSVEAQLSQSLLDTWVFPIANHYDYFGRKNDRSFSVSLVPRRYINKNLALRAEFGLTAIRLYSHFNGVNDSLAQAAGISSSANVTKDDTIRQNFYRFGTALEYIILHRTSLFLYTGGGVTFQQYGPMHWSDYIIDNTDRTRYTNYTSTTPGGFFMGVNTFLGIKAHVLRFVYLGGELSYSLNYYKLGGIQQGVQYNHFPSGGFTNPWTIADNFSQGIQFSKVSPSLYVSFLIQ